MAPAAISFLVLSLQQTAKVDVWKQSIQIKDLVVLLSRGPTKFSSEPRAADRRVHVFVRKQEPLAIAKMTAKTLGLRLVSRGSVWRFERDPAYDLLVKGHEANVQSEVTRALNRLIGHLQRNPPRLDKRDQEKARAMS